MSETFVDLDAIFDQALEETEELIKLGFDISDPCVVTSLGWYANKYPEIAERCNYALLDLIDKQAVATLEFAGSTHYKHDIDSF